MRDGFAWTLGLIVVLYGLYALIAGGAKSEIATACQDYGQVKIDGKWYECKLKVHLYNGRVFHQEGETPERLRLHFSFTGRVMYHYAI